MSEADRLAKAWGLEPHPEGGFFRETVRAPDVDGRPAYTSIIYLLRKGEHSLFHRFDAPELWVHQGGGALRLVELVDGGAKYTSLGPDAAKGQVMQYEVPKHVWFGCEVEDAVDYGVIGCVVVPGFIWQSFEMAKREELLKQYPDAKDVVTRLTEA